MKCDQDELDKVARTATALRNWLAEAVMSPADRQEMPQDVVAVGSVLAFSGQKLTMDYIGIPDSVCWSGGCNSF
ncbi:MAG: hypothetical protein R6X34_01350 [Chloroflexota bacterium]